MSALLKRLRRRRRRALDRAFHARLRHDGVTIGAGARVARGAIVQRNVTIGAGSRVNRGSVLKGREPIRIGRYSDLGEGVRLISENHLLQRASISFDYQFGAGSLSESRGPIRIGNSVWLGDNAIVLAGVSVGDGAVVGAGAVVTRDVDPFTIVAGVPARPLRARFEPAVVEALLELRWWDWPPQRLRECGELFAADLTAPGAAELVRRYAAEPLPAGS